jgi:hypothetical protein
MKASGVRVVTRTLLYSPGLVLMEDGSTQTVPIPREKGIDLRLALDLLRLARHGEFEVALIFSQDSDLAEVVQEIDALRKEMDRWLVVDCAYPHDPASAESAWGIAPFTIPVLTPQTIFHRHRLLGYPAFSRPAQATPGEIGDVGSKAL